MICFLKESIEKLRLAELLHALIDPVVFRIPSHAISEKEPDNDWFLGKGHDAHRLPFTMAQVCLLPAALLRLVLNQFLSQPHQA